jgi:hypothetical protein
MAMFAQHDEEKETLVPSYEHPRQPKSRWRHLERFLAIVGATFLLLGTALAAQGSFQRSGAVSEPGWTTAIGKYLDEPISASSWVETDKLLKG